MFKLKVSAFLVLPLILFTIGCDDNPAAGKASTSHDRNLVGVWEYAAGSTIYYFNEDGTFEKTVAGQLSESGNWRTQNGNIHIDNGLSSYSAEYQIPYTFNGSDLVLTIGSVDLTLKRQNQDPGTDPEDTSGTGPTDPDDTTGTGPTDPPSFTEEFGGVWNLVEVTTTVNGQSQTATGTESEMIIDIASSSVTMYENGEEEIIETTIDVPSGSSLEDVLQVLMEEYTLGMSPSIEANLSGENLVVEMTMTGELLGESFVSVSEMTFEPYSGELPPQEWLVMVPEDTTDTDTVDFPTGPARDPDQLEGAWILIEGNYTIFGQDITETYTQSESPAMVNITASSISFYEHDGLTTEEYTVDIPSGSSIEEALINDALTGDEEGEMSFTVTRSGDNLIIEMNLTTIDMGEEISISENAIFAPYYGDIPPQSWPAISTQSYGSAKRKANAGFSSFFNMRAVNER